MHMHQRKQDWLQKESQLQVLQELRISNADVTAQEFRAITREETTNIPNISSIDATNSHAALDGSTEPHNDHNQAVDETQPINTQSRIPRFIAKPLQLSPGRKMPNRLPTQCDNSKIKSLQNPTTLPPVFLRRASLWSISPYEVVSTM